MRTPTTPREVVELQQVAAREEDLPVKDPVLLSRVRSRSAVRPLYQAAKAHTNKTAPTDSRPRSASKVGRLHSNKETPIHLTQTQTRRMNGRHQRNHRCAANSRAAVRAALKEERMGALEVRLEMARAPKESHNSRRHRVEECPRASSHRVVAPHQLAETGHKLLAVQNIG